DARPLETTHRQVEIALRVHRHAVTTGLGAEIDQHLARSLDLAVGAEPEGVDLHGAWFRRRRLGIDLVGAVVVVGDVQRTFVRTEGDAVGFFEFVGDLDHLVAGVDTIDGPVLQLARLGTEVTRIGEVDAAATVDGEIVGGVEMLAHITVGEDGALATFDVPARDAAATLVGTLASNQIALGVELQAV